jgi:hypothetical protein
VRLGFALVDPPFAIHSLHLTPSQHTTHHTAKTDMVCYLVLLGAAQDAGVPQTGCSCRNCSDVWAGAAPRQFAVSAALVDAESSSFWLLDCTPDFREQDHLLREWLGASATACWLLPTDRTHAKTAASLNSDPCPVV